MLLGNKKTQGDEQNWCIVLSPLRSEIDKKRVAQKISEVFSLSLQEASDVVSNTPIILLDQLAQSVALKIKEYFRISGADMILTNDTFLKRKCYRTVWPEPPNLSFLREVDRRESEAEGVPPPPASPSEELEPDEALQEIRSLAKENGEEPLMNAVQQEALLEEIERWKKECLALREELARYREEYERMAKGLALQTDRHGPFESGYEKQAADLQSRLSNVEEKYEALREEYRQARAIFEEKTVAVMQENERLRKKGQSADQEVLNLRSEKQSLHELLSQKEAGSRLLKEEKEGLENKFQEINNSLQTALKQLAGREQELENSRRELQELAVRAKQFQEEDLKAKMASRLLEKEAHFKGLVKEQERIESEIREREEAIRRILAEQEAVERDILDAKQTQRQIGGQAKREDRVRRLRIDSWSEDEENDK